jgi:hypothetical protein
MPIKPTGIYAPKKTTKTTKATGAGKTISKMVSKATATPAKKVYNPKVTSQNNPMTGKPFPSTSIGVKKVTVTKPVVKKAVPKSNVQNDATSKAQRDKEAANLAKLNAVANKSRTASSSVQNDKTSAAVKAESDFNMKNLNMIANRPQLKTKAAGSVSSTSTPDLVVKSAAAVPLSKKEARKEARKDRKEDRKSTPKAKKGGMVKKKC